MQSVTQPGEIFKFKILSCRTTMQSYPTSNFTLIKLRYAPVLIIILGNKIVLCSFSEVEDEVGRERSC